MIQIHGVFMVSISKSPSNVSSYIQSVALPDEKKSGAMVLHSFELFPFSMLYTQIIQVDL